MCPKCNGQGRQEKPPYISGQQETWTDSTTGGHVCTVCNGKGIISMITGKPPS